MKQGEGCRVMYNQPAKPEPHLLLPKEGIQRPPEDYRIQLVQEVNLYPKSPLSLNCYPQMFELMYLLLNLFLFLPLLQKKHGKIVLPWKRLTNLQGFFAQ